MSLLIKGVEMPNYCDNCPCCHCDSITWDVLCGAEKRIITNKAISQEWKVPGIKRPSWCPLVEIPPHGRLIDASKIPFVKSENGVLEDYAFRYDINELPTIIPASGEGET